MAEFGFGEDFFLEGGIQEFYFVSFSLRQESPFSGNSYALFSAPWLPNSYHSLSRPVPRFGFGEGLFFFCGGILRF